MLVDLFLSGGTKKVKMGKNRVGNGPTGAKTISYFFAYIILHMYMFLYIYVYTGTYSYIHICNWQVFLWVFCSFNFLFPDSTQSGPVFSHETPGQTAAFFLPAWVSQLLRWTMPALWLCSGHLHHHRMILPLQPVGSTAWPMPTMPQPATCWGRWGCCAYHC